MSLKNLKRARCSLIVRPSGTEPVIRFMGEGDDKILVEQAADDVVEALTLAAV
jgi:phosphoglucosamine mutase